MRTTQSDRVAHTDLVFAIERFVLVDEDAVEDPVVGLDGGAGDNSWLLLHRIDNYLAFVTLSTFQTSIRDK